jgi:hypothetical protein
MSYHLRVLQSLVRLSHSNAAPSRTALLRRAGGTDSALSDALDTLVTLGLVQPHHEPGQPEQPEQPDQAHQPLRLTLSGLAVGTAYAAEAARRQEEAKAVEEPVRQVRPRRLGQANVEGPRDRRERRALARSAAASRAA